MCFVGFQEHAAIICLYLIYRLVCVTQTKYVFEVRTGSAKIIKVKHIPCRVNMWKGKTEAVTGIKYPVVFQFPLAHLVVANRQCTYKCIQRSVTAALSSLRILVRLNA
jgi:hypothetical protein